jgi:hypothetical protein
MESNADKQLREKLKGVEYPFDPQAWEQMEAMLDEKKKRRGFFWWWLGSIAAALLITAGTIGYGLWLMGKDDRLAGAEYAQEQVGNGKQAVSTDEQKARSKEQLANDNDEAKGNRQNENISEEQIAKGKEQLTNSKEQTANGKAKAVSSKRELLSTEQQTKAIRPATKQNRKGTQQQHAEKVLEQLANNETNYSNNSAQIELAAPATTTQKQEAVSLNTMYALLNATDDALNADKKEETKLPKKKKWFTYSIGPMANVTGTILSNPFINDTMREKKPFSKGASFMGGFQQEFLFVERFALTTGFFETVQKSVSKHKFDIR